MILIRHGQTEYNKKGVYHGWIESELDDVGISQAEDSAKLLCGEKIDVIYTSPLKRSASTAEIISQSTENPPIIISENIKEVNFGLFDGLSYEEISTKYNDEANKWNEAPLGYHFPEGESIPQFFERIKLFLDELIDKEYKKVVVVSHDGCIKYILSYIMCGSGELFWKFKVSTGSISRISFERDFSFLISLNEN
ncbi:phosphoserine phosphatase 1 [Oxobacter pfennigii]|uniref:Phosphoserine phosphatase 1 n=2 Tax=Oxobacter pfennigii TaxID=36849 RepID=A0A0P8WC19_9CLOT|nr:phosphoserine phosphatase 1 [Oxobacter pfennigii]